jgi:hypothetical protein
MEAVMKIIQLTAENVKRLRAVQIAPTGNLVPITGKNAQGKSSVLDCICYALGGERAIPEQPIREGTAKAEIKLDLGEIVVTRTFTHKGSYLKVQSKEGLEWKSPQKILDQLLGKFSFDPWAFIHLGEARQKEVLLSIVTVPLSVERLRKISGIAVDQNGADPIAKLNTVYKTIYDQRTEHNRDAKRIEASIAAVVVPAGMENVQPVSVTGLFEERKRLEDENRQNEKVREELEILRRRCDDLQETQTRLEAEREEILARLAAVEESLRQAQGSIDEAESLVQSTEERVALLQDHDFAEIDQRMAKADEINRVAAEIKKKQDLEAELAQETEDANRCTEKLEAITSYKSELMEETNFPINGLDFSRGTIAYNGIPLSQASAAERLRVSMAIAMALNPKLKVIRIEQGSLLDQDSWRIIEEMARENDYQVWIEKVADKPGDGIYIYDGQIIEMSEREDGHFFYEGETQDGANGGNGALPPPSSHSPEQPAAVS